MPHTKFNTKRDYEIFYDQNPVPVFQVNRDGKISHCNSAACSMFGYTLDEFTKLTFDQITVPTYLPADRQNFQDLLDNKIDQYDLVKGYITKSGLNFMQHLYVFAERDESTGDLVKVISMVLPATGHTTRLWTMASKNIKVISRIIGISIVIAITIIIKMVFDIDITSIIK